ncbi:hypothetical protein KFK09_011223 [Dendrobium nobile]|uniref:Uncharacterized protein n=1 Tax=Dendrobium nobile TaxID=94219 RepID=A0A8T3BFB9_DENNO|nr:hypothetical protein KFK09_011223 [Dendrobium nobile]
MSITGDPVWAGKKPSKRLGGMAEALSIASDLGFSIPPVEEELKSSSSSSGDKSDELIRVLRELTVVQRSIANLQVELQGRKKQFSELLLKAASDYGALTASVADFQWSQNFREAPSEMLRPIPVALASCTRFFEAMSAMRESFVTLQNHRVGPSSRPMTPSNSSTDDSKYYTP